MVKGPSLSQARYENSPGKYGLIRYLNTVKGKYMKITCYLGKRKIPAKRGFRKKGVSIRGAFAKKGGPFSILELCIIGTFGPPYVISRVKGQHVICILEMLITLLGAAIKYM